MATSEIKQNAICLQKQVEQMICPSMHPQQPCAYQLNHFLYFCEPRRNYISQSMETRTIMQENWLTAKNTPQNGIRN